eukprot:Gb_35078 [translate_table: standard]
MTMAFTHLPRWLWSQKSHDSSISPSSSPSSSSSTSSGSSSSSQSSTIGMRDPEIVKFPSMQEARIPPTPRRGRRKWHSRSERRMDREYDIVLVPSDGGCMSGSESDDSDWSIGWFEPHAPDFSSENEAENSFAVLVPCYGLPSSEPVDSRRVFSTGAESTKTQLLDAILSNLSNGSSADNEKYMEQWLSSLHEH